MLDATNHRPLTGRIHPGAIALVLMGTPVHAEDHLVHAWAALDAARRGENRDRQIAYAANRLACAQAEPIVRAIKPRHRAAFGQEVASLTAALQALVVPVPA